MPADLQPGARRRVIIATDEPAIARILSHKLGREGHAVITVATSRSLDDALADGGADVALVDLLLAGDTANRLASRVTSGWLAIMDGRQPLLAERAMRAGAAGLVRTPFKPTVVASQVATLLTLVAQ